MFHRMVSRSGVVGALGALVLSAAGLGGGAVAAAAEPAPGSPEYVARDAQNIADAYGRQTAPDGQLGNPLYATQLLATQTPQQIADLVQQAAQPNRLAITPGVVFPGWNA